MFLRFSENEDFLALFVRCFTAGFIVQSFLTVLSESEVPMRLSSHGEVCLKFVSWRD